MKKALLFVLAVAVVSCSETTAPTAKPLSATPTTRRPASDQADPVLVYQNDFAAAVGGEWSSTLRSTSPSGQTFLGEFLNDTVGLIVLLPAHTQLVVTADVYVIRSWDGADNQWGPDSFTMGVDGATLLNTTFSNVDSNQNYPFSVGGTQVSAKSSAFASNTLGYTYFETYEPIDAIYRLSYTVSHTAAFAYVYFGAGGLQRLSDESWGLDNVRISIIP